MSYHSCSGKDPQLSKGPPTARITVANPPFTQWIALILFQSTKLEIGEKEKKEVLLKSRGFAPEIGLMQIRVWAFEKMKMQRVKRH